MRRLETMARGHFGVFSSQDAASVGVSTRELAALVRQRQIVRIRRGAYVLADAYQAAEPDEQYGLRVLAIMRSRPRGDRASHHSALALYRVSTFAAPTNVVLIESGVCRSRREGGVLVHPRPSATAGGSVQDIGCVSAALACVQVAARYGFEAGLCAMDSALNREKCTRTELEAAVSHLPKQKRAKVLRVIAMTEPLTESVGETRTRIILLDAGFQVRAQVEIREGRTLLGRVDFVVDNCVVVEFDGLVKYEGKNGKHALAAEKDRETQISWKGYEVVRLVWSDLDNPSAVVRRIQEAKRRALHRRAAIRA